MVISDQSVTGQAAVNSTISPVSEYQEVVPVPSGEIWYVEGVSYDQDDTDSTAPQDLAIGITSSPGGFTDLEQEQIRRAGRSARDQSPEARGTLALGAYAYGDDEIAMSFDTPSTCAPYYRITIRQVL